MSELLDFPLMILLPAVLTVGLSIWMTLLLKRRRWHWTAVLLTSIAAVLLIIGFGYYGTLWVFKIGPAGTDPNGFNIGGAMFLYGFLLPLSAVVSVIATVLRRVWAA